MPQPITNILGHVTLREEYHISVALMQLMVPSHIFIFDTVGQTATHEYRSLHAVKYNDVRSRTLPHPAALTHKQRVLTLHARRLKPQHVELQLRALHLLHDIVAGCR